MSDDASAPISSSGSRTEAPPVASARRGWAARIASRWALALVVGLCALHIAGVWISMEGWEGLTGRYPLWRFDHPLYYHSTFVTRSFLAQSGTTAGYDPWFMAGYPKSVIFPASSTLPELFMAAFGRSNPVFAYKLYVFLGASSVVVLFAAAGRLWNLSDASLAVALALYIIYLWSDFPINYVAYGMVPYFVAIPIGLTATSAFGRYSRTRSIAWWLISAGSMVAVVLVHFTSALIVAPAALAIYLATLRTPVEGTPSRSRWAYHLGVWAIPVLVLVGNAFWWLPGLWLAETKGPSDFAFAHPEGVLVRLRQVFTQEPEIELCLWIGGLAGLVALARRDRLTTVGLGSFLGAGFGWGYLAGGLRSLDFLQPGRHTFAFYSGFCLASGVAVTELLRWLRGRSRFRLDLVALVAIVGLVGWWTGPSLESEVRLKALAKLPFLSSRPSPRLLWVINRVKTFVRPGERLLYEEGGFGVPGTIDPYQNGRFSGLIPAMLGIECIGGPYLHASLTTNFTQFGENQLFGKVGWDRERFVRYARLYRPSAILCWTPNARRFCRSNPDLIRIVADDGSLTLGRITGFEGDAIVGKATVEATSGRLRVRQAEAGLDGSIVLRYHSVPCLRTEPPVAWESVYLEEDPVPFIKLRPPPGTVEFELRIPPGSGGAPAR